MRALIFILLAAVLWIILGNTLQWVEALAGVLMVGALYLYLRRVPLTGVFAKGWVWVMGPFSAIAGMVRFAWAVAKANWRVALIIINFRRPVRPAILKVNAGELGDLEQTIIANSITLTPGTITVDFSPDRQHMYVHVLDIDDIESGRQELLRHLEVHFGEGLKWWKLP